MPLLQHGLASELITQEGLPQREAPDTTQVTAPLLLPRLSSLPTQPRCLTAWSGSLALPLSNYYVSAQVTQPGTSIAPQSAEGNHYILFTR